MTDRVVAKMFLNRVGRSTYGGEVELSAVTRGQDNKAWASATPSGSIKLTIRNELALEFFKDPADEFFVTFTRAPKGEEGMADA